MAVPKSSNNLCNLVLRQLFGSFNVFPISAECTREVRNDPCTRVIAAAGCAFTAAVTDSITSTLIVFFSLFRLMCTCANFFNFFKFFNFTSFDTFAVCFYVVCLVSCPVFPVCGDSIDSFDFVTLTYKVNSKANKYVQDDRFGRSVSISGNYALIGADEDLAAFIFERDSQSNRWNQVQKIVSSDYVPDDPFFASSFGYYVALSANYAIVGDREIEQSTGASTGAAYIFEKNNQSSLLWVQVAKLTVDNVEFGCSVDIDGDYAIIGACGGDDWTGSAHIYQRINTEWTLIKNCTPFDAIENFAWSVSISGDTAFVGAMNDDNSGLGEKTGSVYVYQLGYDGKTWNFSTKLVANDAMDGYGHRDCFGGSVSVYGDVAIIGASGGCDIVNVFYFGVQNGKAYIFQRSANGSWIQTAQLFPYDSFKGDYFGRRVSINEEYAIVSSSQGVYVFAQESFNFSVNETSEWNEVMKLSNTEFSQKGCFGCALEISQDNNDILIGAWSYGTAYFFNPDSTFGPTMEPTMEPTIAPTLLPPISSGGKSTGAKYTTKTITLAFVIIGSTFAVSIGVLGLYTRYCQKKNRTSELTTLDAEGYNRL